MNIVGSETLVNAWLRKLIDKALSLPKMNSVDVKEVMMAFYETEFGIFDHYSPENMKHRPIASVELHDTEAFDEVSARAELMIAFAEKNVREHFNISWPDFIRQPRAHVNMMLDISERQTLKKQKLEAEAQAQAKQNMALAAQQMGKKQ